MQRWEYKVISLRDGRYTESLNDYGREGWELVAVASDVHGPPPEQPDGGHDLPVPGLGKVGMAAATLSKLGGETAAEAEPAGTTTTLLWVLRRPLDDDAY